MSATEFKPGDWVIYVPNHAHGDLAHVDCERGTVTSIGGETSGLVFVRYGAELHSKATSLGDLVSAVQYFASLHASHQPPSQRQPPRTALRNYLGDGLFADFDGFNVVLSAENGQYSHDTVYLEPSVVKSFGNFLADRIAPLFKQEG